MPTRGTTSLGDDVAKLVGISIHVPTRGTTADNTCNGGGGDFNPRAHEGHDGQEIDMTSSSNNFNPRAHEGHDDLYVTVNSKNGNFNPRAHEGHDAFPLNPVQIDNDFNPRAHEGHDGLYLAAFQY